MRRIMRTRTMQALCLSAALMSMAGFASPVQACPMCKAALEKDPDPAARARPKAYMYSILFMLSMPATLTAAFGISFYRLSRQQHAINQSLASGYAARLSDEENFPE